MMSHFCVAILLQPGATATARPGSGRRHASAMGAVAADFHSSYNDVELALALDLAFKPIEQIALELHYFSAAQARHVQVVALWSALVIMLLPFEMHQVQFVYQTMALEQGQRPVHRHAIDMRIDLPRLAQDLASIHMLFCSFDHA